MISQLVLCYNEFIASKTSLYNCGTFQITVLGAGKIRKSYEFDHVFPAEATQGVYTTPVL
jgi:hypothetical protein